MKLPRVKPVRWIVPTVVYAVVAVTLSWPLVLHLGTHHLGYDDHPGLRGDLFFQYNLQRQMEQGQWPSLSHTDLLSHPAGSEIDARVAFSQYMIAYIALMTVMDLLPARNVAGLLFLVLNALTMHLLARQLFRRESLAWLAGLAFAFSPYVFLKVDQGFVQKSCLFFAPLFLLFVLRVVRRGRWWEHAGLTLSMLGLLALYPPYGVFSLALGSVLAGAEAWRRRELVPALKRVAPSVVAVLLAFAAVMLSIRDDPRPVSMSPTVETFALNGGYLDPSQPVRWYPYENTFEVAPCDVIPVLPLGLPVTLTVIALLAAVLGAPRARAALIAVAVMLVVMIGPYLVLGDEDVRRHVPMPFLTLVQLPLGSVLGFPIRLFPWVTLALIIAAGGGIRILEGLVAERSPRLAVALVPALIGVMALEHAMVFPEYRRFVVDELQVPQFYADTAEEEYGAVLLLPPSPMFSNDYLHEAVVSGRPLVNAYMDQPTSIPLPEHHPGPATARLLLVALQAEGVGYVVAKEWGYLDPNYMTLRSGMEPGAVADEGPDPYRWLDHLCGPPAVYPDDDMVVYEVPPAL